MLVIYWSVIRIQLNSNKLLGFSRTPGLGFGRFTGITLKKIPYGLWNQRYQGVEPLKYRSGSGSRNLIFNGSVRVQLHQNLKVRVRFRFNDLKFRRFKCGSGSPKKSGFYWFAVQVQFDSLLVSDSLNFEKQEECYTAQHMSKDFY